MLLSIFEWLAQCIAGLLDLSVNAFLGCLDLKLSVYMQAFPLLADVYELLQVVGLGMTLLVGVVGLFNFLFLKSFEMRYVERPEQVLVKTALAAGLVYYGGYILEFVVQLASWSFAMFGSLGGTSTGALSSIFSADSIGQAVEELALTGTVTELTLITVSLVLVALVAYNVLKLLLEVAERYMMVGVLVYTSPLVYCTISSANTVQIFKRWMSMFVSSCIMMSMSALFLRLIVNGLYSINVDKTLFVQLLLVLAMCKIAQRVDTYLQQLGLTTATTGASMIQDLVGMAALARTGGAVAGRAFNGKGSRSSILGGSGAGPIRASGPVASAINGIRSGREAFVNGASFTSSVRTGARAAGETMRRTAYGGAVAGAVQARREGTNVVQGAARGAAEGMAQGAAQFVAPSTMNAHRANVAEQQRIANELRQEAGRQQTADNMDASAQAMAYGAGSAHQPVPQEVRDRIHDDNGRPFTNSEADANFAAYGVAEQGQSALTPSGVKSMDEYKADAVQTLKGENSKFAADYANYAGSADGHYASGDPHYMSADDFNNKWGSEINSKAAELAAADAPGDGAGMELSDNAIASGLSIQETGGDQMYVHGREDQVGAFLANEYTRKAPGTLDGGKSDADYKDMAIQSLESESSSSEFDHDQYVLDMGTMEKGDFMAKYSRQIDSRAEEFRNKDNAASLAAAKSYYDTVNNTAAYASPNAIVHGFYDNGGTLEGNDRLGNAMMERGFSAIANERAEGTSFSGVRAYDRPASVNEVTGERLAGGRAVEALYTDRQGNPQTVRIYDHAAYTSMTEMERSALHSYVASDGRQLWTTANISVNAEARVASTSSRRVSGGQRRNTSSRPLGGPERTMPPKKNSGRR